MVLRRALGQGRSTQPDGEVLHAGELLEVFSTYRADRQRSLTPNERQLLFVYCSGHVVAQCLPCGLSFRLMELAADPLGGRANVCPRCRRDLTENVRTHLYSCMNLPREVLLRAREVREAAERLVKQSQQAIDCHR